MKPGIPWSVKGIDAETREAAKEAARRAGMTLGAWLNAVILDQSEDDDPPQPLPVSRRRMPYPAPSRRRPGDPGQAVKSGEISERLDSLADKLNALTEGERDTAVDRFMTTPPERTRAPDQTVRAVLDRLARHEQRTSSTIEQILGRIDGLGRELTELAEEAAQPGLRKSEPAHAALELALRNIVDHLEISERRTRDALRGLHQRLGDLGQRAVAAPELERLVALERRIDGIDLGLRQTLEQQHLLQEAIHGLGASDSPQGQMLDALHRQIAQFTERVVGVEGRVGHLAALENAMGQLYRALEEGRAEMSTVAEKVAARVAHDVFTQYPRVAAPSLELQALQEGLEAVRATGAEADRRSRDTLAAVHETLEQVIAKLAELEARGPVSEPPPGVAMPLPASPDEPEPDSPEPTIARTTTWHQAVRAHLAAQGQAQPAAPLADFRLPPLAGWPETPSSPHEGLSAEPVEPGDPASRADKVPGVATRHDFIAAARRAAMAAQPTVGSRRTRPEGLPRLLSRLRNVRDRVGTGLAGDAAAPVSGLRRRLLIAGLVLLAMASAYAIGTRELALPKSAPSTAAPAVGTTAPAPAATSPAVPMPPLPAPKLPEPDRQPAATGKSTAFEMLDTLATASLSQAPAMTDLVATGRAPEGTTDALWQAARSGDREAAFVVASRFLDGREVGKDQAAAQWLERAAAKGLAPAQYRLATLYERGTGVARDPAKAGRFYEQAAVQGNVRAMHNLAVLLSGSGGHEVDMPAAARWFREAALQGLKDSQFNLAILHERGLGVARSAKEAIYWYALAAAQGDADAKARVELLRATLPRRDGDEAVRRAAAFRPREQLRDANIVSVSNPDWVLEPQGPAMGAPIGPLGESELILRTKTLLSRLGFDIGDADTTMDGRTANAIRLVQLRRGLPVNGMVSRDLLGQLQASDDA